MDAAIAEATELEGDSEVREGMMAKAQVREPCLSFDMFPEGNGPPQEASGTGGLGGIQQAYRGTSLIKNCPPIGPYTRTMLRALRRS